jgi:small subunit ribosomal protein S6
VQATSEAVAEVERQLKILDEVVRFKTVRPDVRIRANR